jgi:hypothetical protein
MGRLISIIAAVTAINLSATASAEQLGGGAAPDVSVIRIGAALLFCLALAFGGAVLLRRRGTTGGWAEMWRRGTGRLNEAQLEIIEMRRLSAHADLCLVRHQGTDYLILCGPAQAQLLSRTPAA